METMESSDSPAEMRPNEAEEEAEKNETEIKETEESVSESDGQSTAPTKKRAARLPKGSFPPSLTLEDAASIITKFYEDTGGEASYDPLSALTGNSSSSSVFQRKIATLRNFGLIKDENRQVSLTELGFLIAAPHDPVDRITALTEAFLKIEIFEKVYERYKGRILPQDEFLTNAFTTYVPREFAGEWVRTFKSSATTAGLIEDRNGKLQVRESARVPTPEKEDTPKPPAPKSNDFPPRVDEPPPPPPTNMTRTPLPLGPGKLAYIELPNGWDSKDLKKLLRILALALGENSEEVDKILNSL